MERTDEQLAETLAAVAGDKLLALLVTLSDDELAQVCDATGYDPGALAHLCAPPRTRGDCERGLRPCPYRTCRHHVNEGTEPVCALDVAEEGGATLEQIGEIMAISRERVRQIESAALRKIDGRARLLRLDDLCRRDRSPESGRAPALSRRPLLDPEQRHPNTVLYHVRP